MKGQKAIPEKVREMRLAIPGDLMEEVRKFRAEKLLRDEPLTSNEKAILHLMRRGLEAERSVLA